MLQRLGIVTTVAATTIVFFSSFAFSAGYYTIQDQKPDQTNLLQDSPLDPLTVMSTSIEALSAGMMDLMSWQQHSQNLPDPAEPYKRVQQFGTWVTDPAEGTCRNTRARVLIRFSEVPVTMNPKGCTVVSGKWLDPYTHRYVSRASDLDIDHVVPLKNSYRSGAWQWDYKKRCLYGNFLANSFHLLAVNREDNRKKGDGGPERFMPSERSYACEYVSNWLKIKLIWNLALASAEGQAIEEIVKENQCDPAILSISESDLRSQRKAIQANMGLCH